MTESIGCSLRAVELVLISRVGCWSKLNLAHRNHRPAQHRRSRSGLLCRQSNISETNCWQLFKPTSGALEKAHNSLCCAPRPPTRREAFKVVRIGWSLSRVSIEGQFSNSRGYKATHDGFPAGGLCHRQVNLGTAFPMHLPASYLYL
jgi:hypothetical protein